MARTNEEIIAEAEGAKAEAGRYDARAEFEHRMFRIMVEILLDCRDILKAIATRVGA